MQSFINKLPKTELHLHIEGTLEPELLFQLAQKNAVKIPFASVEEIRHAYQFSDLQSFLDMYFAGMSVLLTEEDFYDLSYAYFKKAAEQNICHAEIFFDPQAHIARDVDIGTVFEGLHRAQTDAQKNLNLSSHLILCFLRDKSEQDALDTLEKALTYRDYFIGVGLDSTEKGNPPKKFERIFKRAHDEGLICVAHAGEEGSADYIWQALKLLNICRIDHGVRCVDDPQLMTFLAERQIPVTVCPMSNIKLCVFATMEQHPIKKMLDQNLCVTINSDDPAYFGGYVNENYLAVQQAFNLSKQELCNLAKNSFKASLLSDAKKLNFIAEIENIPC